jgi:hypothetical protein
MKQGADCRPGEEGLQSTLEEGEQGKEHKADRCGLAGAAHGDHDPEVRDADECG